MIKQPRYSFWKVFWVMLALYVFFGFITVMAISLVPEEAAKVGQMKVWKTVLKISISLVFATLFYYISINTYYRFITTKRPLLSYLRFAGISSIAYFCYHLISDYVFPTGELKDYNKTSLLVFASVINTIVYIGFSLLVAYLTNLRDEQKQRKVLEEQKLQLEIEKSQANFNFLKAQINPHFLHNTLNFLYAKSLPYSPELSEGILTLSDIMRYALSEGNARDGKAPLKDEIEHLRNVIKINQLRFSNNLNVQLDVQGVINGAQIIPFVLITLVENAFKHGDLKDQQFPIIIKIKVEERSLYFYSRNKKKTGPKELSTGIGLDNIKKRLDLAYARNYQFRVMDEAEFYTTELTIDPL